jgi:hypothetical protein
VILRIPPKEQGRKVYRFLILLKEMSARLKESEGEVCPVLNPDAAKAEDALDPLRGLIRPE